jgi:hypothetical protein
MKYKNKKLQEIFGKTLQEEKEQQSKNRRSFLKKAGLAVSALLASRWLQPPIR